MASSWHSTASQATAAQTTGSNRWPSAHRHDGHFQADVAWPCRLANPLRTVTTASWGYGCPLGEIDEDDVDGSADSDTQDRPSAEREVDSGSYGDSDGGERRGVWSGSDGAAKGRGGEDRENSYGHPGGQLLQ